MTPSPHSIEPLPPPGNPDRIPLLQAPATRREVLLFGLLILALIWGTTDTRPRTVITVPDMAVRTGVIT